MPKINILTKHERDDFDNPPKFNADMRSKFFDFPEELKERIKKFKTATNKVGFILQWGYFRSCGKFFTPSQFYKKDINYISNLLELNSNDVNISNYNDSTLKGHKEIIAKTLKCRLFGADENNVLQLKITDLIKEQVKPRQILINSIEFLKGSDIEIPNYNVFSTMITDGFNQFEEHLLTTIENTLTVEDAVVLDKLLPDKMNAKSYQRSTLTLFKSINQSTRKGKINKSLRIFNEITKLFEKFTPLLNELQLSPEAIKYYAIWVCKARTEQLNQFKRAAKRYLHVLAFITYQYYLRQDIFNDTFLKAVQSGINTSNVARDNSIVESSQVNAKTLLLLADGNQNKDRILKNIRILAFNETKADTDKIHNIQNLFIEYDTQSTASIPIDYNAIKANATKTIKAEDYADNLEKVSLVLQGKVSGIVKSIGFNDEISDKDLMEAINYFKLKEGVINEIAPQAFLDAKFKNLLYTDEGKFRVSLYKALLFTHMFDGIKSGKLTLKHSFRYLSVDEYLIEKSDWRLNRTQFIKRAKLSKFTSIDHVLKKFKKKLIKLYIQINASYKLGKNKYLEVDKDGKLKVKTPKVEKFNTKKVSELLFNNRYVPIVHILTEVNNVCGFINGFQHYSVKNVKGKLTPALLLAGIMGKGCNIGLNKIALTSKGINVNELNHMVNWYFSIENINAANDHIIKFINKLSLPQLFLNDKKLLHTGSDGQRKAITVESLNANWSFKFFGNSQGVSIYRFIDERHILFYATVISSAEREAGYVLDGLLHNNEIKSDIHSTDTHGFSEVIFCLMHLFGITFAPRLANFKDLVLYGFSAKKTYQNKGYDIIPEKTIKTKLIKTYWDDILRIMVSIKLKKVTASQLLKRLSSYAKENPLYAALREFGRLVKTHFILTYASDLKLRQSIQKQLNKIELANKFSNAIFFDNNREFHYADKEDQEIVVGCIRLMQNAVILWNYMYLSQYLVNCKTEEETAQLIETIKNGSILLWRHVNMHGEYDFITLLKAVNDDIFDVEKILALNVA
jgi:TnpA family transposase